MNSRSILCFALIIIGLALPLVAEAATTITVTPITWNIIGLDSNDVNAGPNDFPVGARVCNTGASTASNVQASFVWDSSNSYIDIRPGTNSSLSVSSLAAGACTDFYFEVAVTRNSSAYNTTRRYHIEVTADGGSTTGSTSTPRELYVEHLVSQARNSVTNMLIAPDVSGTPGTYVSVAPGGAFSLVVGNTYWIKLVGYTATAGYEQIETFVNFPNTIFQVLRVDTTYTAESSANMVPYTPGPPPLYDNLYGNACIWENDPNSPNYRSCLSTGKAGGDITVSYRVKILSVPSSPLVNPEPLNTLIYDFSGSSYHYNSDYEATPRIVIIVDPTNASMTKSFNPDTIGVGGVSRLTITLNNPNAAAVSGFNFTDPLPTTSGPSTQMEVANPPNASTSSCGSPTFSPSAGDTTLTFSNGTIAANGSCSISVNVTTTTAAATSYTNTTNNLYIYDTDTTKNASAILTVTTAPIPPGPPTACSTPVEMARWNLSSYTPSTSTNNGPFNPSSTASGLSAVASYGASGSSASGIANNTTYPTGWDKPDAQTPSDTASWGIRGGWGATSYVPDGTSTPYFQFEVDSVSAYGGISISSDYNMQGNWSNGDNWYILYSTDGTSWSGIASGPWDKSSGWKSGITALSGDSGSSGPNKVYFRIFLSGAQYSGNPSTTSATVYVDNISVSGCLRPDPPTVTKSFSPTTVPIGSTSTLTLTIANPNSSGQTLYGVAIDDYLPSYALEGTVNTDGTSTVTGTGTAFRSQLTAGSFVRIPSTPVSLPNTVTANNGSTTVTTSSGFSANLAAGRIIAIDSVNYMVATVTSDISLELSRPYQGTSGSGKSAATYKTYKVASIESDTSLTLASTAPSGSNQTYSSGVTLVTAPTTTCGSSVKGTAETATTAYSAISLTGGNLTGTLAFTNGSTSVTGTGTAFSSELGAGSILFVPFQLASTVSVTNGSRIVDGTNSSSFTTEMTTGSLIRIGSDTVDYIVSHVISNKKLELTTAYAGSTASGLTARSYKEYSVASVGSDTSLTLSTAYSSAANLSGLTIKAGLAGGSSCTITATVRDSAAGVRTNVTEMVSATESGKNTTSTGYASATLTVVLPPVISKKFSTNPMLTGGTTTLTFTIANPNTSDTLTGLTFTDVFPVAPAAMTLANTTTSNTCGGSLTDSGGGGLNAGDVGIQLTGGSVAGNSTCTVSVNVTAGTATSSIAGTVSVTNNSATVNGSGTSFTTELAAGYTIYIAGTPYVVSSVTDNTTLILTSVYAGSTASGIYVIKGYFNLSGSVVSTNGGTGNKASDTLEVKNATPNISLLKQVGSSSTGPWFSTLTTTVGANVYYRFTLENIGDVALDPFSVTDPTLQGLGFGNPISCTWSISPSTTLPVATVSTDPTATCVVGPTTAQSGSNSNTATANGTYGGTGYPSNTSTAYYKTTGLSIEKSVLEQVYTQAGDKLNYSYTVTNSGSASLSGPVTVTDDKIASVDCPAVSTVGDFDNFFDPNESMICGKKMSGTVAVTDGSAAITGSGTSFSASLIVGDSVFIKSVAYRVSAITDDTHLTLSTNYSGTTATGLDIYTTVEYTIQAADATPGGSVTNTAYASTTATLDIPSVTSPEVSKTVNYNPTFAYLSSFGAYEDNGRLGIEWTTSSEVDTVGFYLYRLNESSGRYVRINKEILPGLIISNQGGTYSLIDTGALPDGTYTYLLVERQGSGPNRIYGPFTVRAGQETVMGAINNVTSEMPGRCAGQSCSGGYSGKASGIASYYDNGGALNFTNVKMGKALAEDDSGVDLYSNFVRKPREMSEAKKARLNQVKGLKKAFKQARKMRKGDSAKISVGAEGLYYMDVATIAKLLGKSSSEVVRMVRDSQLTLANRGQAVAYLAAANNAGIYFYGEEIASMYTNDNIYWLGKGNGLRMDSVSGNVPNPVSGGAFTQQLHIEQNRWMIPNLSLDPKADHWIWDWVFAFPFSFPDWDTRTFNVLVDGAAAVPVTATLAVKLQGFVDTPSVNPDQHVVVRLNGSTLTPTVSGDDRWDGLNAHTVRYSIDQGTKGLLIDGNNTLVVQAVGDAGASFSGFYIDSFDLTYQRLYRAKDNKLIFSPENDPVVTVHGFSDPNIIVFDVTNPKTPKLVTRVKVTGSAGNYSVTLARGVTAETFLAVSLSAVMTNPDTWADNPSALSARKNRADYLIIVPDELKEAAQPLSDYRRSRGLETMIVSLEDIMDEFNYGISSPEAIRDFLGFAYRNWEKTPRYVVLAGEGTYDYKDYMGFGDNFLPTLMAGTPLGIYPSDNLFADVDGDHVPEFAIGRLSVASTDEFNTVINKIKVYEAGSGNCVLFLAGNPDEGGDFPVDSDYIATLLPSPYVTKKVYLSQFPTLADAQASMLNVLEGAACGNVVLVNYMGHGDWDCIGRNSIYNEGLLCSGYLGTTMNWKGIPVFTAMTCLAGDAFKPGMDSLSESLMLSKSAAGTAFWASTGLSMNELSKVLDEGFFASKTSYGRNGAALGDLVVEAMKWYFSKGLPTYELDIHNLQGDPALRMK